MKIEDIKAYCQSKNRAYEDHPFGDIPVCYKLNGKDICTDLSSRRGAEDYIKMQS